MVQRRKSSTMLLHLNCGFPSIILTGSRAVATRAGLAEDWQQGLTV